jgi:signal transduction histidine kinase
MKKEKITWKFHPRVFNSLGADLVTDDIVAIIELVKNAYDAGADKVTISFLKDTSVEKREEKKTKKNEKQSKENDFILEIFDNGQGMTQRIIEDVWFTVATPYKEKNKTVTINKETKRTVSGEKGLGRLSAARLGSVLEMYTKSVEESSYKVTIDWDNVAMANQETFAGGILEEVEFPYNNCETGTVLRIKNLRENWFPNKEDDENEQDEDKIEILENNLSRFISPFNDVKKTGNFQVFIKNPIASQPINISTPDFLNHPIYSIKGEVSETGSISYIYNIDDGRDRKKRKKANIPAKDVFGIKSDKENPLESFCGPFRFEIRVWDVDSESTEIFTKRFNINKVKLQEQISFHKGISVYRDGVLVLPKTNTARDWLGLDIRRISRVGKRISNRQIIGYVSISEEKNKKIEDASNREGFKNTKEVRLFKKYLTKIVGCLEQLREDDKTDAKHKEPAFSDVLAGLLPSELKDKVETIINEKGNYNDILKAVREYESKANETREELSKRAYYYSRLASIGTMASFLIHEIRNRTGSISDLHDKLREPEIYKQMVGHIEKHLIHAEDAVNALEILSNTFSPLAIKNPNPKKMICDPIEQLKTSISSFRTDIEKKDISIDYNQTSVALKMYPGELNTIFCNLLSNSIYWLRGIEKKEKAIKIQFKINSGKNRLTIKFSDSGPGVGDGTEEKIFWPGWTKRNDGFGMGLTVASELVSQYNGNMSLIKPGELDGLTLKFDLPILQ